jgi:hypothetical protein
MVQIQIEGIFSATGYESLADLITDWVGRPTYKARVIGEELLYKDEAIELYCQTAATRTESHEDFIISGGFTGDPEEGKTWLSKLTTLCPQRNIGCDITASQLDNAGNPTGDEFEIVVETP